MSFVFKFSVYACIAIVFTSAQSIEQRINTPGEKGEDVVNEVVNQVQDIFGNDKDYLARVACAESNNGLDANTYRDGYYGGIWQVDEIGFRSTQDVASHPGLSSKYERIEDVTGISWPEVSWEDLQKPLYSGLAARLHTSNVPEPIPVDVREQAEYWKEHYNTQAGQGNPDNFPNGKKRQVDDGKNIDDFINCPSCVCREQSFSKSLKGSILLIGSLATCIIHLCL